MTEETAVVRCGMNNSRKDQLAGYWYYGLEEQSRTVTQSVG